MSGCPLRDEPRVAARGHADAGFEMPVEMALVGEAAGGGGFGERCASSNRPARCCHPAGDEIAMRRGAKRGAEGAGEGEAIEAGLALEVAGADRPRIVVIE